MSTALLTIDQAVEFTGYSKPYLYRLTSSRIIPFYKPTGKMIFFGKEELLAWMKSKRYESLNETQAKAANYIASTL